MTAIAARWGFTSSGLFAELYRQTYGQPPAHGAAGLGRISELMAVLLRAPLGVSRARRRSGRQGVWPSPSSAARCDSASTAPTNSPDSTREIPGRWRRCTTSRTGMTAVSNGAVAEASRQPGRGARTRRPIGGDTFRPEQTMRC
ncbi:MAG: hypothetical protein JWR32_3358 [Mycobacterium sp.]|nr:hypothetical protein [Mycobacterium sp.]